jgi:four helix bundle protein
VKDFRQLTVWEKAHQLTLAVYEATRGFPTDERYGETSQIRRCSASIAANIAEGCGRSGDGEFHRFLQTAMGSAVELDYHLLLCRDLHYLDGATYSRLEEKVVEVKSMLAALIRKVAADRASGAAGR